MWIIIKKKRIYYHFVTHKINIIVISNFVIYFKQGQAVAQLCKTIDDVTLFGVASKAKHEALVANGLITHLIERGTDYLNEVRK